MVSIESDELFDLFEDLPLAPSRLKRTYSKRNHAVFYNDESGLATPPASSSPPASPIAQRAKVLPAFTSQKTGEFRPTARSITTLLERSNNAVSTKSKVRKPIAQTTKKALVQMHLNLLPAHVTCKECCMSYTRTSSSDNALHASFHTSHLHGLPLPSSLALTNGVHKLSYNKTSERNMMVKCIELVDLELSASLAPMNSSFVSFIMVDKARIQSFVLVQPIKCARRLDGTSGEEKEEVPAIMGVSRMWTARRARGQGCVRELLNRALREFVQGCFLHKREVAFTQLSNSGMKVVEKWQAGGLTLIYCD